MKSQPPVKKTPKKGRPLEDGLRDRLLDHTLRVLLRDGYQKFSMNAVAQSAKASKETLYRHFGDKAGLLHAALIRNASLIDPLLKEGLETARSTEERLFRLGMNYLRGCYLPEALALQRIAYADGKRGLGPLFATEITEHAIAIIVNEFSQLGSRTPQADAETFLGMIQGKLHEKIMLGVQMENLDAALEQQVHHALQMLEDYLANMSSRGT